MRRGRGELMMSNKGWDWAKVGEDVWLKPSEESIAMLYRWKTQGFKKILDIGCGKGRHALLFAKHGFEVSAIDISASAIEETLQTLSANGVTCHKFVQICVTFLLATENLMRFSLT